MKVFLMGQGVELDRIDDPKFNVPEQARAMLAAGGQFLACGTCLKLRESKGSELCPLSTLKDLYEIVRDSDRLVTL
ncbi:MAG: DsrE family protein [Opitutae bacterium]|nr:DsrE family protein [Opitutae bacterium]